MKSGISLSENSKYMVFNKSSYEEVVSSRKNIVENINRQISDIPFECGDVMNMPVVKSNDELLPIVCIINGAGKNGKDTLIKMMDKYLTMYNFDSVGEVKYVTDMMLTMGDAALNTGAMQHKLLKDNTYRSFLHDVKMAWSKYTNGSLIMSVGKLKAVLIESAHTYKYPINIIFFHIREPEEIEKLKKICEEKFGLVCMTLLVYGLSNPEDYDNDGDKNVMNYDYDISIHNDPNQLDSLERIAKYFCRAITDSNDLFGFDKSNLIVLPENENGEKLINKNKKIVEA